LTSALESSSREQGQLAFSAAFGLHVQGSIMPGEKAMEPCHQGCLRWGAALVGSQANRDEVFRLNVGGRTFASARSTLLKSPKGSVLHELLASRQGPDNVYFLDRDGRHFHCILNFLRDGPEEYTPPLDTDTRRELLREAIFYGLTDLAGLLQESYVGAPLPSNEEERLARLESLSILHTEERDRHYDNITRMIAAVLDVPIALISLVHKDHQWFKSRCGLEANSTSRSGSFCAFTFAPEEPLNSTMVVVENAQLDMRFKDNPLVLGEPHIAFYAGCPLITSDGIRLGALCAIDRKPRTISSSQSQLLVNFAQLAVQEIERAQLIKGADNAQVALSFEDLALGPPPPSAFAAGPLRAERMREALREAVCMIIARLDVMEWPLLYANRSFSETTGVEVIPPLRFPGKSCIVGGLPGRQCSLWDYLKPFDESDKDCLDTLRTKLSEQWFLSAPAIFSLSATLEGPDRMAVPVSCRFTPAEIPLDVAAAAITPSPQRKEGKVNRATSRLFFVTMIPMSGGKFQREVSETNSDSKFLREVSGASQTNAKKGSGKTLQSISQLKPARPPFVDVRLMRLVGEGSFGKVSYGLWMGAPVAVKVIEWKKTQQTKLQPIFEAALSTNLAHPNLVQTFKYSTREKSVTVSKEYASEYEGVLETWLVQEWCDLGTLHAHCNRPRLEAADRPEIFDIFLEISSAGYYLHSRGIIHGDLTANNVLLKTQVSRKGYVAKICDFGLARILEDDVLAIATDSLGTVTHMPPELFRLDGKTRLTQKADIYATGVLLWQALTGEAPFEGLAPPQVVMRVVKGGRLKLPEEAPEEFRGLFVRVTAADPTERPDFDVLVAFFSGGVNSPVNENQGPPSESSDAKDGVN